MSTAKSSGKKGLTKSKGSGHLLDTIIGCSDMVLLDPLTVENMAKNLRERHNVGEIYVSTIVLLCVVYFYF